MTITTTSRRTALKLMLVGSVVSLGTACNALPALPRSRSGHTTDGSFLANKVGKALSENPFTSQLALDIKSDEDEVIIKGFVKSQTEISNVEMVAGQVDGVRFALVDLFIKN